MNKNDDYWYQAEYQYSEFEHDESLCQATSQATTQRYSTKKNTLIVRVTCLILVASLALSGIVSMLALL